MNSATFDLKFGRFKTLSEEEKYGIMRGRSSENTNKATKLWIDVFCDYLNEKDLPKIDDIADLDLPQILSDFYTEIKKKESPPKKGKSEQKHNENQDLEYKNSSLYCMRAALNRYFKEKQGLDIISNENFIKTNEMFKGVTKKGRREGRGSSEHKNPITEADMNLISKYFTETRKQVGFMQSCFCAGFYLVSWTPHGVHVKTMWCSCGNHVVSLWTLCGIHVETK